MPFEGERPPFDSSSAEPGDAVYVKVYKQEELEPGIYLGPYTAGDGSFGLEHRIALDKYRDAFYNVTAVMDRDVRAWKAAAPDKQNPRHHHGLFPGPLRGDTGSVVLGGSFRGRGRRGPLTREAALEELREKYDELAEDYGARLGRVSAMELLEMWFDDLESREIELKDWGLTYSEAADLAATLPNVTR
jgi:hypothetical protein